MASTVALAASSSPSHRAAALTRSPVLNLTAAAAAAPADPSSMGSLSPRPSAMDSLVLYEPPPLDPAWLEYEREMGLPTPRKVVPALERQPVYADECRALHARMMAPGARDHHLSQGVASRALAVPSSRDGFAVPVIRYDLAAEAGREPRTVVVYYHGGGLHVGEADSEELSCRRILKDAALARPVAVYSVGYRLMPRHAAAVCLADSADGLVHVRARHPSARLLVVGSSSGGQLAALVAQAAPRGAVQGVVLRCPVTSDAFSGTAYVPARWRALHTSAARLAFRTSLLGVMARAVPRDGLDRMPLEAPEAVLAGLPRHWVQVCTNDMLYSDGLCYAAALEAAGVDVALDVVKGWPHTFWLSAPQLDRALEADRAMLAGLAWVAAAGPDGGDGA